MTKMPWKRKAALFEFVYNLGDIFTWDDPQQVYNLVLFAREFAILNQCGFHLAKNAMGLLDHVTSTRYLNMPNGYAIWDVYKYIPQDPNTISIGEWLEMNGLSVPEFTEEMWDRRQ